jgi:hypothetical protein
MKEDFRSLSNYLTQKGFRVEQEETNSLYADNDLIDVYVSYNDEDFYRFEIMNLQLENETIEQAVAIAYQVIDKTEGSIFQSLEKGIEAFFKSYQLFTELGL